VAGFAVALGEREAWRFPDWSQIRASFERPLQFVRRDGGWSSVQSEIEALAAVYVFSDHQMVESYLENAPGIRALLFDGTPWIRGIFGEGAQPVLSRIEDPDEGADEELLLEIETGTGADDAIARLQRFDARWWRDASVRDPRLIIDVV
jgi:hypothetical protein